MASNTYKSNNFKKKKSKESGKKKINLNFSFFSDRRLHLVFGFFFLIASLFLLIAFISYLFTGKADQSIVESLGDTSMLTEGREAENWMKLTGAVASYYFIFKWIGIGAFLIPPLMFNWGYSIVFKRTLLPVKSSTSFVIFTSFWLSVLLGYLVVKADGQSSLDFICGGIGFELASVFENLMGWGTLLFLFFSLVAFIIYFFNVTTIGGLTSSVEKGIKDVEDHLQDEWSEMKRSVSGDSKIENDTDNENQSDLTDYEEEVINAHQNSDEDELNAWEITSNEKKEKIRKAEETDKLELEVEDPLDTSSLEDDLLSDDEDELSLEIEDSVKSEKTVAQLENYDPTLDLSSYKYPPLDILKSHDSGQVKVSKEELEQNKDKIVETLVNFKIGISSIKATIGPTVTLYEIVPEAGVKISKIKNLEDDIALSLAALGIRIIAPIPGRGTIGIEVPNKNREMVSLKSLLSTEKFTKAGYELPIALGKTISNEVFISDLAKMPHLLMAGATGQGKSVGLNVILASLIYKKHPSQLKFVLVDPKKVELTLFNKIERHFLAMLPNSEEAIITDTKKVVYTLNSLCEEMDTRYDLLKDAGCRNLKEYNNKFVNRRLNPENGHRFLPYIVVVIDELADLMMTAGKEVETPIARLAQLARAVGLHLVIATQRPSVNVITGTIKANFPARLSFRVTSKIDSRTILDTGGAEQLVGMGDMLLSTGSDMLRLQCAFVDTPEVEELCEFVGSQRGYPSAYMLPEYEGDEDSGIGDVDLSERDVLFDDAARLIVMHQQGSTSLIQRKLKLGYNRAGRLIDQLEAAGVVGGFEGSKAREVLIQDESSLEQLLNDLNNKK
ncbi:FtsK/SpoIIIE family DNA translocase [Marinigracilibium pacificum]|uniref:DNA translocase FtsK n=1 Tax=Marinigracilibium pacificum TaxID=2729599 RepID=A0A848IX38_9BACT|nr:DNA translocase FtsK [Marinigracilibium pacificum]NMM49093.1 DNA translocase FtsK [Marinigracilibium pacificum]